MRNTKMAASTILAAVTLLSGPAMAMAHGNTTEPADDPALCAPYLALTASFNGEPDPAAVEALVTEAEAAAPEDLADTLGVLTGAVRTILETGDFAAFETPEVTEAKSALDTWVFESCAFDTKLEVAASEYAFGGFPEELSAGTFAIALHNMGEEVHELVIIRRLEETTESWDELLALPEDEAMTKTEFVGARSLPCPIRWACSPVSSCRATTSPCASSRRVRLRAPTARRLPTPRRTSCTACVTSSPSPVEPGSPDGHESPTGGEQPSGPDRASGPQGASPRPRQRVAQRQGRKRLRLIDAEPLLCSADVGFHGSGSVAGGPGAGRALAVPGLVAGSGRADHRSSGRRSSAASA